MNLNLSHAYQTIAEDYDGYQALRLAQPVLAAGTKRGADARRLSHRPSSRPSVLGVADYSSKRFQTVLDLIMKAAEAKSTAQAESLVQAKSGEHEEDNLKLEQKLKIYHLQQMMIAFNSHDPPPIREEDPDGYSPAKLIQREKGSLNRYEFKSIIGKILDTHEFDDQLDKLFTILDVSGDGYVDWHEFSMYMLVQFQENDHLRSKRLPPFATQPKIKIIAPNRQETTSKILAMDCPLRYVTVSKEGAFSMWDPNLRLENVYYMPQETVNAGGQKRRFKTWVTDAVYMPNVKKIAVGSTNCDVRFFEASSSVFQEIVLHSLPDVPYCFDYYYDQKNPNSESYLFMGSDGGQIYVFYFPTPLVGLFNAHSKASGSDRLKLATGEEYQRIFWPNIAEHSKAVQVTVISSVHNEAIRKLMYLPHNDMIISSSNDPKNSLIIMDKYKKRRPYNFKVNKGVECFDFSKDLNLLVTGSSDHAVRLWNPYVTSKPVAILEGHSSGIADVKIYENLSYVITYSKDCTLKAWCIRDHVCIATMVIKFPMAGGTQPEHGMFPLRLQQAPANTLLICCADFIAHVKVGQKDASLLNQARTHNSPLCCALYNPHYRQIVTGCNDSEISVWELETGQRSFTFDNAHGDEEITSMAFDCTWRRLITGARNGSLKVWNFRTGHNLHQCERIGEAEVTGIISSEEKKAFIVVGWNRQIVLYDDSQPDNLFIPANVAWMGGQLHQDDIISADFCPPNLLATGGFDGQMIVWTVETEKVFLHLRKGKTQDIYKKLHELTDVAAADAADNAKANRPASSTAERLRLRKQSLHKHFSVEDEQPAPVDKLLFLRNRIKSPDSAQLVSSECGWLRWWSVFGQEHSMGAFCAVDSFEDSVLALASDDANSVVVTGDTAGFLKVWNSQNYCIDTNHLLPTPRLELSLHAHQSAIVSLNFVESDYGQFIVTASTDQTAQLFARDGQCVGIFGQSEPWDIREPLSWLCNASLRAQLSEAAPAEQPEQPLAAPRERDAPAAKRPVNQAATPVDIKTLSTSSTASDRADSVANNLLLRRGNTSVERPTLGIKFERELTRMKLDRQERRQQYGEVDGRKVTRMGKQCAPFQALATKEITNTEIPSHLPISRLMKYRGINTLTEQQLISYNFDATPADLLYNDPYAGGS